jgi:hypothetical protein
LITVLGTSAASINGGSATSYINGPLCRTISGPASTADYLFPVGKTAYHLFELNGLATGGSGTGTITIEAFEEPTTGTGTSGLRNPLFADNFYWEYLPALNSVTLSTISSVRLTADYITPPAKFIGLSVDATHNGGTYSSIGGTYGTGTILSTLPFTLDNTARYFTIAEVEPLSGTYTVGAGGDYLNLTEIAEELRMKTVTGNLIFILQSDYEGFPGGSTPETFPVVFTQFSTTDPNFTVTIKLADGLTNRLTHNETDNISTALIHFNGIDNLIFDGQGRDAGGAITGINEWTFSVKTNINNIPTFLFQNDASHNSLNFLNIEGNAIDDGTKTNAVIVLGTTSNTS